jgi:hypothetical protein
MDSIAGFRFYDILLLVPDYCMDNGNNIFKRCPGMSAMSAMSALGSIMKQE